MGNVSPAEIQDHLEGMDYPANKNDLKKHAKDHGADQEVVNFIDKLPEKDYNSPVDVTKEVGKIE
jgi:hypothetical protein